MLSISTQVQPSTLLSLDLFSVVYLLGCALNIADWSTACQLRFLSEISYFHLKFYFQFVSILGSR